MEQNLLKVNALKMINGKFVEDFKIIDTTDYNCQNQALEKLLEFYDVVEF